MDYTKTHEYAMISLVYGRRKTERSGVPLINHIDEGIEIMVSRNASERAIRAYIVHPVFQGDDNLQSAIDDTKWEMDWHVVALAMEYRRAANNYLCRPDTDDWTLEDIRRAVGLLLPEVREMLIADKLQNQKDFRLYHYGTHARSEQLERYFNNWMELLEIEK